mmetsp:Transcript_28523/g.62781  ORF Transcript_28523/g.62781 Transcript_28523/m.62781 type:complete len:185 (-) Transcript_28523:1017-1571(-)
MPAATTVKNDPLGAVFVTVGTTKFDALIKAVDNQELADVLAKKGYTKLVVQRGAGAYVPSVLVEAGKSTAKLPNGLNVEFFDYAPTLAEHISSASLIISHAGAGSIFEALSMGKPLIVVPNSLLMDNHQAELGHTLAAAKYLVCATPEGLVDAVRALDTSKLLPYEKGDAAGIAQVIDKVVGFA